MTVLVRAEPRARAMRAADVRARAERMLAAMRLTGAELSILLCGDATIHALNRDYRDKDRATDVLAFAMREGAPEHTLALHAAILGDVVISIDTAARQARAHGRGLEEDVTMLLAHGLLHLLGMDHRDDTEERRMTACTDLLRSVAISPKNRAHDRSRHLRSRRKPQS
jgi:probable rRNA maturation factor